MIPQTSSPELSGGELADAIPRAQARPGSKPNSILAHAWGRAIVPSLSDLLFVAMIVWLFMSSGAHGWQSLLADADVGWHIRTGEYILSHHAVPHHDLYSFSKPGAPWYAWEWLTDVIDGSLVWAAGLKGVVLTAGVIIALFATTLMRRMIDGARISSSRCWWRCWRRRGLHAFPGPAACLYAAAVIDFACGFLETDRDRPEPARIWWLVPITMVWTNLHGGFLVLIAACSGFATLGAAVECVSR